LLNLVLGAAVRLKQIHELEIELQGSETDLRQWLSMASPEKVNKLREGFPEVFEWLDRQTT
jgi:hypothetical protein